MRNEGGVARRDPIRTKRGKKETNMTKGQFSKFGNGLLKRGERWGNYDCCSSTDGSDGVPSLYGVPQSVSLSVSLVTTKKARF